MATILPRMTPLTFASRLRRLVPYFHGSRWSLVAAAVATAIGSLSEPLIPALMKPLLDSGFQRGALPLWAVPATVIGLFTVLPHSK